MLTRRPLPSVPRYIALACTATLISGTSAHAQVARMPDGRVCTLGHGTAYYGTLLSHRIRFASPDDVVFDVDNGEKPGSPPSLGCYENPIPIRVMGIKFDFILPKRALSAPHPYFNFPPGEFSLFAHGDFADSVRDFDRWTIAELKAHCESQRLRIQALGDGANACIDVPGGSIEYLFFDLTTLRRPSGGVFYGTPMGVKLLFEYEIVPGVLLEYRERVECPTGFNTPWETKPPPDGTCLPRDLIPEYDRQARQAFQAALTDTQ